MKETTLIIGGCRSGKSRHALELAEKISGSKRIFIATCMPLDDEMKERIDRHKKERDKSWTTIEAPIELPKVINEKSREGDVILVDCLTLWINNLIMETEDSDIINQRIHKLILSLKEAKCLVILVSNEVGAGIVPENRLARLFRDYAGFVNQKVAECADSVIWMVAGIPVVIKSKSLS
ncbi:MAG: bifunctional adenosylcobinamide kinase/adenosylcobinamide-phosphate guanylyltransferase [Deltaproteobacteria bacterium]|nr:bifunctional adenosylcobinamide kinase/adenosylcobinamide-phosphate guanylyltransferase [Deltaproteobacteria bacterium]MBW2589780.1 bifunctional adenosylcobinamide kinase/adenosylcobinamide-phosphate guanylyltransferase [Deltaproteobacteria bacterium]